MFFKVLIIPIRFLNRITVMRPTPRLATLLILPISRPLPHSRVMVPTPTQSRLTLIKELCGTETSEEGLDPGPASIRTALASKLAMLFVLLTAFLCLLELRTS